MDFGDPRSAMISVFGILYAVTWPLTIVGWPVLWVFHGSVRGSRWHYVAGTLAPVVILAAVFCWACRFVGDVLKEEPLWWLPIDVLCASLWVFEWYRWRRHRDDDDFWNGLGGRIKGWVRRRSARLVPSFR